MMKIKHILFFLPLLFSVAAWAQDHRASEYYDEIYLKDGSIYHGYISQQLNTGEIEIIYDWAIHSFDSSDATVNKVENGAIVAVNNRVYGNIELLAEGDVISFKDLSGGSLDSMTSEIVKTVRAITPAMNDLIKMKDGRVYRGHIVEVVPGKTMTIQQDNGVPVVIYSKNILTNARERKAKELSYVSQYPFFEEYELKNGVKYTGLRVNQDYTRGSIMFNDVTDIPNSFDLSEVKVIRKSVGMSVPDKMEDTEVLINGKSYTGVVAELDDYTYTIPADQPLRYIMVPSGKMVLEVNNSVCDNDPTVSSPYTLVEFNATKIKAKDGKKLSKYELDAVKKPSKEHFIMQPDSSVRGSMTTKFTYDNLSAGIYALYCLKEKNIFVIWVN